MTTGTKSKILAVLAYASVVAALFTFAGPVAAVLSVVGICLVTF